MKKLLIVDDEKRVREGIRLALMGEPYELAETDNLESAYKAAASGACDLMILDVHFKEGQTCHTLLERLQLESIQLPILILSGAANAKEAADAIRLGAYDYLEKPVEAERLRISLQNMQEASAMRATAIGITVNRNNRSDLVGVSTALDKIRSLIQQYAGKDVKILITGETGTGKEVVAHAVWRQSGRNRKPFIIVNSAAIPESLVESELFGHKKGAFTGATSDQMGKIEMADGGTLFLDEIAELSPMAQSKLLRFLETGEIQVLGSNRIKHCDVRLIAATSRDLAAEIKAGRFREDLFFRLNVAPIVIPPLRERSDDVIPIFDFFVKGFCQRYGENVRTLDHDAAKPLQRHRWPGNVRELRNVAERAVLISQNNISAAMIQDILGPTKQEDEGSSFTTPLTEVIPIKEFRRRSEAQYLNFVLQSVKGSVSQAAILLEVDRSHLHQKLKELGVVKP